MTTDKEILLKQAEALDLAADELRSNGDGLAAASVSSRAAGYRAIAAAGFSSVEEAASLPSPDGETPRTDAMVVEFPTGFGGQPQEYVRANFARGLEEAMCENYRKFDKADVALTAAQAKLANPSVSEREWRTLTETLTAQLTEANASIAAMREEMDSAQDILCAALPRGLVHDRGGLLPHAKQVAAELSRHSSIASDAATGDTKTCK